jgi:hypothetical protein
MEDRSFDYKNNQELVLCLELSETILALKAGYARLKDN